MTKTIIRVITAGSLLILSALLLVLATCLPTLFFSFYPDLSRDAVGALAAATSIIPVPLCELLLVGLILWFILSLVQALRRKRIVRWLSGVLVAVMVLGTAFLGLWGLNYYAPPMEKRLSFAKDEYTAEQLTEAAGYYLQQANFYAGQTTRDADGTLTAVDFSTLSDQAGDGYEVLARSMDCFDGSTVGVKKLLSGKLMAKVSMTGVFICLTGESCVSAAAYKAEIPFIMCHEIGHRMAFAREDEANFAAFLACAASDSAVFRYSGYFSAFTYCIGALNKIDTAKAQSLWNAASPEVIADWNASVENYRSQRSDTATKVTDKVYDTYLKSFSVESGSQSYGEVTDLLIAWYYERLK